MSRMDTESWTREALARADAVAGPGPGPLAALRASGRAAFSGMELPGRRNESWKYSRVGALLEEGLLDRPDAAADWDDPGALIGTEPLRIALVDGAVRSLPEAPEGVTIQRLSEVEGALAEQVDARLGSLAPAADRPFVALNASLAEDGLVIHVGRDVRVDRPIELLFAQADGAPCGAHPRVILVLETGARAMLIERQTGTDLRFTNAVIETFVEDSARLDHLRLALDAGEGRWLTALDVRVGRGGHYALHQALVGSAFRRSEIRLRAAGEGARIEVGGATLTRDRTHLDIQMCLEHEVPHCSSNQVFRAIAGEKSRTVLNGRIHIHPHAQKTAAELSSRNLLLSAEAEIDAKPELEIYADDVTCAHGATVGRLDEQALFYLRARGIDATRARTLLAFAFLAAVVDAFPDEAVRDAVRPQLERLFSAPAGGSVTATEAS